MIGVLAAIFTTAAFLPQTIKVLRTGQTKDLSLYMYIIMTLGLFLWLAYGIATSQLPLILSNAICFPLCATILIMKIREK